MSERTTTIEILVSDRDKSLRIKGLKSFAEFFHDLLNNADGEGTGISVIIKIPESDLQRALMRTFNSLKMKTEAQVAEALEKERLKEVHDRQVRKLITGNEECIEEDLKKVNEALSQNPNDPQLIAHRQRLIRRMITGKEG